MNKDYYQNKKDNSYRYNPRYSRGGYRGERGGRGGNNGYQPNNQRRFQPNYN